MKNSKGNNCEKSCEKIWKKGLAGKNSKIGWGNKKNIKKLRVKIATKNAGKFIK